jgi:hypothetical protein
MILESDYPEVLKDALQRADALSRTLAEPALLVRLDRWAIGRSEEIARFVELVVGDWRLGALSDTAAAEELESYVRTLEGALHECVTARDALSPVPPRSAVELRSRARGTE